MLVCCTHIKHPTQASLLIGSASRAARSNKSAYSVGQAHCWRRLRGELKYTGTEIFVMSLPIDSLIIVHKLIFILGSLKNGNCSLVSNLSSPFISLLSSSSIYCIVNLIYFPPPPFLCYIINVDTKLSCAL